jgi:hypothetical protein
VRLPDPPSSARALRSLPAMPSARPPAGQRSFVSAAVDAAIDRLTARFADVDLAQVRAVP